MSAAAGLLCWLVVVCLLSLLLLIKVCTIKWQKRDGRERALEGMHPRVFSRGCSGGHAAGLLRQSGVVSSLAATTKEIERVHRA